MPEQLERMDTESLETLYQFFTLDHGEAGDYEIAAYAEENQVESKS